ncbi:MAG: hypothetical protein IKA42_02250 [Clostridia bacterium]|nr:hypothetical protein [Clostridia bacterium]
MCCFLNRRCIPNNCCCGNWNENAWQTNNATAFNDNFLNRYGNVPYFYDDNVAYDFAPFGYNGYSQYNATSFFLTTVAETQDILQTILSLTDLCQQVFCTRQIIIAF